jgi:membrane-associated protein
MGEGWSRAYGMRAARRRATCSIDAGPNNAVRARGCSRCTTSRIRRLFLLPYLQRDFLENRGRLRPRSTPMLESIRHLIHTLYDVQGLIRWGGTLMVCGIVFMETGFFVGFFLPGDSLLVTAGIFSAAGILNVWTLLPLAILCAIAGDQIGYFIGRQAGHALYSRPDSLIFKRKHLQRAHQFYETYGGKTVILARYVPIVRTFCPPVAGAAEMTYSRYLAYDIVGGTLWVGSMILGGYGVGKLMPNLGEKIHYVIIVVVFVSLLPGIIGAIRARRRDIPAAAAEPGAEPNGATE